MNLDGPKPVPVNITILADKTGTRPTAADGTPLPWPDAGIILDPIPQRMTLPERWLRKHLGKRNSITVTGLRQVTRPSRPDPDVDENGSAAVAGHHYEPAEDNPLGMGAPHELLQADEITFHTPDGDLAYEVVRQPDKYVTGDTTGRKRVTVERYASGETEVEHFFTLKLSKGA